MGYKTGHHLRMSEPLTARQMLKAMYGTSPGEGGLFDAWDSSDIGYVLSPPDGCVCSQNETGKWDEDGDMGALAKVFPTVRFTLTVGDEGVQYVVYYLGEDEERVEPGIPASTLWEE